MICLGIEFLGRRVGQIVPYRFPKGWGQPFVQSIHCAGEREQVQGAFQEWKRVHM